MSEEVRFKIGDKVYDTATVDEISLRDVVSFNSQAAEMGLGVTWADVERIATEAADRKASDEAHPEALILFAVTVWAARRIAGEDVTLDEALDVPLKDIEIVEAPKAPKDHKPKKGSTSSRRPKGSGLAVAPAASDPSQSTTPPTSEARSASA